MITLKWKKRGRPSKKDQACKEIVEQLIQSEQGKILEVINEAYMQSVLYGVGSSIEVSWDGNEITYKVAK